MKRIIIALFLTVGLLLLTSCGNKANAQEPSPIFEINEQDWNKEINNYGFAKREKSKVSYQIYSSIFDENDLEPDTILSKDGLIYEITHIVSSRRFVSYIDFSKDSAEAYYRYGVDQTYYFKKSEDITIDEMIDEFVPNLKCEYRNLTFKDNQYVTDVTIDGGNGKAYYKFESGRLLSFRIYLDGELYYKMVADWGTSKFELPNVHCLNEMPPEEMGRYLREMLKEFKMYGAIDADYTVDVFNHYVVAEFEYKRIQDSEGNYKTQTQLIEELKKYIVDNNFGKYVSVIGQLEVLDELCWFGMFEDGNQNGLIIKLKAEDGKLKVIFAVTEFELLNIIVLKEYLEPRFSKESDGFFFDSSTYIDNKDCLVIKYKCEIEGDFEQLLSYTKTCVGDNRYEWVSSCSSSDFHYDIYEYDTKAVKINFISNDYCYILELTLCVSFCDTDPSDILEFGYSPALFE